MTLWINKDPVNANVCATLCPKHKETTVWTGWTQRTDVWSVTDVADLSRRTKHPHCHMSTGTCGQEITPSRAHVNKFTCASPPPDPVIPPPLSCSAQYIIGPDVPWTLGSPSDTAHRQTHTPSGTWTHSHSVKWPESHREGRRWHQRGCDGGSCQRARFHICLLWPLSMLWTFRGHARTHTHKHNPCSYLANEPIRNDWTCQDQLDHRREEIQRGNARCHTSTHTYNLSPLNDFKSN